MDEKPQGEGDGGNVELVGDVGGSSNDLVVNAFDLDNLILVEPNDDAQKDLDDDGEMMMKIMIFIKMILLENWTWFFEEICDFFNYLNVLILKTYVL